LTTVIAVQCQDGIIICADSQETFGSYTKEDVTKIHSVGFGDKFDKYCMLGCAGASNYISLFREYVGKKFVSRQGMTYFDALDSAICDYTNYIQRRKILLGNLSFEQEGNPEYPDALFVGYDPANDKTQMYELNLPHPPREVLAPHRAIIGTGRLYSSQFFIMAEKFMHKIGLDWPLLSTRLVSQFCYMVVGRVISYDVSSGGKVLFYRIDKTGFTGLPDDIMFPGYGKDGETRLSVLLRTALEELPKDKLLKLAKMYNADKIFLKFFSAGSPSEK
jgi:hypothetical protein